MKVTKAQAQSNRTHIVETAATLFRVRGFDGVGVADLMSAAGFTHGGFYKHFGSKVDLMAEAASCGVAETVAKAEGADMVGYVKQYLSRDHRDSPGDGCTIAALCGDAARQDERVKAAFAAGLESLLAVLEREGEALTTAKRKRARARRIDGIAHAVGAIMLSRACPDDSPLADEILEVCRSAMLSQISETPKK